MKIAQDFLDIQCIMQYECFDDVACISLLTFQSSFSLNNIKCTIFDSICFSLLFADIDITSPNNLIIFHLF